MRRRKRRLTRLFAEISSVLAPCLFACLQEYVKNGQDVANEHVVEKLRRMLKNQQEGISKTLREGELLRASIAAAVDRFTIHDGEENLLAGTAKSHLASVEQQLKVGRAQVERIGKAIEYLKKCGYKVDPKTAGIGVNFHLPGYTTWNSSTW